MRVHSDPCISSPRTALLSAIRVRRISTHPNYFIVVLRNGSAYFIPFLIPLLLSSFALLWRYLLDTIVRLHLTFLVFKGVLSLLSWPFILRPSIQAVHSQRSVRQVWSLFLFTFSRILQYFFGHGRFNSSLITSSLSFDDSLHCVRCLAIFRHPPQLRTVAAFRSRCDSVSTLAPFLARASKA